MRDSKQNKHYLIIGLARTGYHAILQWVAKQMGIPVVFCNNINQDFEYRRRNTYNIKFFNRSIDSLVESKSTPTNIIYSLENFDLRGYKELFGEYDFEEIIIVVRDPHNWIASSLKKGGDLANLKETWNPSELEYSRWFCQSMSRFCMYKQYMQEVLGETNLIGRPFITVNYNEWFANKGYRRTIADHMNLKFTDKGIKEVPRYGGGSSFSGYMCDGFADKMGVLNRWESMEEEVMEYIDEDLKGYSKKYFNIGDK